MIDQVAGVLTVAGAVFVALAGLGVVRLHDVYARMHAATKASTMAVVLIGVAGFLVLDSGRWKVTLAAVLLFVTAPSAAHLIGRAAHDAEGIDLRIDGADELAERMRAPGDDTE